MASCAGPMAPWQIPGNEAVLAAEHGFQKPLPICLMRLASMLIENEKKRGKQEIALQLEIN